MENNDHSFSSITLKADKEVTNKLQTSCLIGKIILETALDKQFVKCVTSSKWNCKKEFVVSYIAQNTFMFSFEDYADYVNVLLNAPWFVKGGLLILSPWTSGEILHDFLFGSSPFWVQVHGLPLDYLTVENGYMIGRELGTTVCVDRKVFDEKLEWGKIMRIRVVIDITNPLKTGFVLRRGLLPCIWVDFKYERLCQFCYNCGRIGHVYRTCKFSTSSAKFGPSLRALTHFDSPYFGAKARVLSRSRREICTDLVVLPPSKSIVRQPMDKLYVLQHICPRMKPQHGSSSAPEVTMSYLWRKFALNSIDSTVMVMNSAIIFSNVSRANVCESKWWLLMVIAGYLLYLALKMNREVRGLCFFKGYVVQDLTERSMVVFTEIFIFVLLFLMPFY